MIKRLFASFIVLVTVLIEIPWCIMTIFGMILFPLWKWILWVVTGKSVTIEQYWEHVIVSPLYVIDRLSISKKAKCILGWDNKKQEEE